MFGDDSLNPDKDPDAFVEYLFENCTIIGDAAYCRDKLAEVEERLGLNYIISWQNFGGLSHEATMASQKRFIDEVVPAYV